jgi:hypothetical protein
MAIPMIAAGIAARAIAKKLATRAVGGITGVGAKQVAPVYKEQGFSNSVLSRPSYTPKNSLNTGSVKVVPSKSMKRYTGDTDELTMVARPKASAPIKPKTSNSIKINSNMRAR